MLLLADNIDQILNGPETETIKNGNIFGCIFFRDLTIAFMA
jgi:hypothetical protein